MINRLKKLRDDGRWDEAYEFFLGNAEALSVFPDAVRIYASALFKSGNANTGMGVLSDHYERFKEDSGFVKDFAIRRQDAGDVAEAEILWSEFEKLRKNKGLPESYYLYKAKLLFLSGREAHGIKLIEEGLELYPKSSKLVRLKADNSLTMLTGKYRVNDRRVGMSPAKKAICDFLRFGFIPHVRLARRQAHWYDRILSDPRIPAFQPGDTRGAKQLLTKIVSDIKVTRGLEHVKIGITAGYDSRGLLGSILDVFDERYVLGFTRGVEGNVDYDLARFYTKDVLTNHFRIESSEGRYETNWNPFNSRPMGFAFQITTKKKHVRLESNPYFDSAPVFHGYLGDALSGKRLPKVLSSNWEEACFNFVKRNTPFVRNSLFYDLLFPSDYVAGDFLPALPLMQSDILYDDQLNLLFRQDQRVRYQAQQFYDDEMRRLKETQFRDKAVKLHASRICPYMDARWQKSMLQLPFELRKDAIFYHSFLKESYPDIFLDLNDPDNPAFNRLKNISKEEKFRQYSHTDWGALYENNVEFRSLAKTTIGNLAKRPGLWFDPRFIFEAIESKVEGYSLTLWGLLSLEFNLKAGTLPSPDAVSFEDWRG